jgi:thiol-disulfide isomerase/thioredoxin
MILLCALGIAAYAQETNYLINGTWEGGDGSVVVLQKEIAKKTYDKIDSTIVQNGRFELKGKVPNIDRWTLAVAGGLHQILLDGEPIIATVTSEVKEVKGEKRTNNTVKITGSIEQEILQDGQKFELGKAFMSFGLMLAMSKERDNREKLDSLVNMSNEITKAQDKKIHALIESNTDSYAVTYILSEIFAKDYPFVDLERYTNNLTPRIKASYPGKLLLKRVKELSQVNMGGIAPDIEQLSPEGVPVKLSSLRGKYVLLDFWASWCGPCLREVPNVKAIYEKYHDKGFEIYGVSLDNEKQREAWLAAIEKHGMNWVHVSSLQGWECPVAKRYNVTGIPKMYLLDKEGRVIAIDLRGEELKAKVASLFE